MTTAIRVEGLDALQAKLGQLATNQALVPQMHRSLATLHAVVVKYPPPPQYSGGAAWMTAKQRRWFFANLRKGLIDVPYRRTGKLGQSWTTSVDATAAGLTGVLGNNRSYARYVQDRDLQAKIHVDRWPTAQDVIEDKTAAIVAGFEKEIARLLRTP